MEPPVEASGARNPGRLESHRPQLPTRMTRYLGSSGSLDCREGGRAGLSRQQGGRGCWIVQEALIEHLLCARHSARHWGKAANKPDPVCTLTGISHVRQRVGSQEIDRNATALERMMGGVWGGGQVSEAFRRWC